MQRRVLPCGVWVLLAVFALLQPGCAATGSEPGEGEVLQPMTGTRHWLGPAYWGNRLHDWRFSEGRFECVTPQGWLAMRTLHDLTKQVTDSTKAFETSVVLALPKPAQGQAYPADSASGILLGVGRGEMDYRAASIVHNWSGYGAGLFVGIDGTGQVFIVDNEKPWELGQETPDTPDERPATVRLVVKATYEPGSRDGDAIVLPKQRLVVEAFDAADGALIGSAQKKIDIGRVLGNVALISHPGEKADNKRPALFAFEDWSITGDALTSTADQANSVVLGTQYTLTNQTLKLTAQLMPLGEGDPLSAALQVDRGDGWEAADTAEVIVPGWTATFRVENWDDTQDTPYRVVYRLPDGDATHTYTWQGTVRRDPVEKPEIVVAALNCNQMNAKGLARGKWNRNPEHESSNWVQGMYFPHAEVTSKVEQHRPDLLFFAGDQVYEGRSPTFADTANIELDYLYKWYLFVISYRDLMKDIPTVTIPDDHDVYQGNVWGQGGRKSPGRDHDGGYVHPASFVNMVHRTQTSHLPDPVDDTPIEQGITYYTCDVKWGRVSFAVFADRMFKNGCNGQGLPPSGTGRPDHYNNPAFDTAELDLPGMKLLGERQLDFLDHWAGDWKGVDMKMALSQTVFANMGTHHGESLFHLIADLDSNGWPQTGRNKALASLRKAFAIHIAGDQHLATLVHHGIDDHKDAIWSFCVPSVANFYPRAWAPEIQNPYRVPEPEEYLGDRLDGFKNKVTVYAAANPGKDMGHTPKTLHDGMPGYGIIIVDKPNRTYTVQCWPRFADPSDDTQQYEGWPRTIKQMENDGRKPVGYLGEMIVKGPDLDSFVVQVRKQPTNELVYALRVKGNTFKPMVYEDAKYSVIVSRPEEGKEWAIKDQKIDGKPTMIMMLDRQ